MQTKTRRLLFGVMVVILALIFIPIFSWVLLMSIFFLAFSFMDLVTDIGDVRFANDSSEPVTIEFILQNHDNNSFYHSKPVTLAAGEVYETDIGFDQIRCVLFPPSDRRLGFSGSENHMTLSALYASSMGCPVVEK